MSEILDPAIGQTEYRIGIYLNGCSVGDPVAIHNTHGGVLHIRLTTITEISSITKGRLTTEHGSAYVGYRWYVRTGRGCHAPKGQSHLIIPDEAVLRFAAENPNGVAMIYKTAQLYGTDTAKN